MTRFLTLLVLVAFLLVACGGEVSTEELPGYVPEEVDAYSDGLTIDGASWTNVTWVEVVDSSTGVVFYQATITQGTIHIVFDPQAGTDYILEMEESLFQGTPFEMIDPYGLFWGTLTLEIDGTVTWTPPAEGEYIPDSPEIQNVPQDAG